MKEEDQSEISLGEVRDGIDLGFILRTIKMDIEDDPEGNNMPLEILKNTISNTKVAKSKFTVMRNEPINEIKRQHALTQVRDS